MARFLRIVLVAIVALAVLVLLFEVVFPWVESITQDPTIGLVSAPAA